MSVPNVGAELYRQHLAETTELSLRLARALLMLDDARRERDELRESLAYWHDAAAERNSS